MNKQRLRQYTAKTEIIPRWDLNHLTIVSDGGVKHLLASDRYCLNSWGGAEQKIPEIAENTRAISLAHSRELV